MIFFCKLLNKFCPFLFILILFNSKNNTFFQKLETKKKCITELLKVHDSTQPTDIALIIVRWGFLPIFFLIPADIKFKKIHIYI